MYSSWDSLSLYKRPNKIPCNMLHIRWNDFRAFVNSLNYTHSKLCSITHVATKVHVILRSFVVLTWMRDTIDLV